VAKYKVQCDYSGQVVYAHETRMTWDGKRVYYKYWEPRQPQDISPVPAADVQTVPNPRPRNIVDFVPAASTEYLNTRAGVNQSGLEFGAGNVASVPGTLGINYFNPVAANINYWIDTLKAKYIRIPFLAERMFEAVDGDIDATYYGLVKTIVDNVLDSGAIPIIDMHNYTQFIISGVEYDLGDPEYTVAEFTEQWRKLALSTGFGYDSRIEFDLMNEPELTNLTSAQWVTALNSTIAAIRGENATNVIHIEVGAASGVAFLFNVDRAFELENLVDSQNNWVLHLHGYFDVDFNGGGDLSTNSDIDLIRYYPVVRDFIYDLRETHPNLKIHHGEYGAGINTGGDLAHQNFHQFIIDNSDVMRSSTIWGGGAYWGTYELETDPEPINGGAFRNPTELILSANLQIKDGTRPNIGLDFTDTSVPTDVLSITRASVGYAQTKTGLWSAFSTGELRRTDRGILVEDAATNLVARDLIGTGTDVEVTTASGQADFIGGVNGFTITEAGAGSVSHYNSIDTSSYLAVDTDYVWQCLVKFKANWWSWLHSRTPDTFSVYNYYDRDRDVKAGEWKMQAVRISRDSGTSIIRSRIGFQPDDTPVRSDIPDAYTKASPERVMSVCCPMITAGTRVQSPIFGASANETRQKDDISLTGEALRFMQGDEFTIILEVGELDYNAEVSNILSINGTVALRRNADNSAGGDVISTLATSAAFNGIDSFLYPRRVALSYKAVTESVLTPTVTLAAEGLGNPVSATGSFATITAAKIEPFGGYLRKLRIYDRYVEGQELINLLESI
jgi:aryl-phospho-beta-D-glucosidase BglC (GH1 family)